MGSLLVAGAKAAVTPKGLIAIGTAVGVAGQIQVGRVAQTQAQSAQNIADYKAAVMEQEAKAIEQRATFEQKRQAERATRIRSALTAKIGAAGGLGSPVATDLAAEQAAELELENLMIGFEAEVGARRALSQAEIDRLTGRVARRRERAAVTAGRIRVGETLLTGFGRAFV